MQTTAIDYSFQQRGVEMGFTVCADPSGPPPHRLLLASPVGTGKSYVARGIQARLAQHGVRCGIFSSRVDILLGIADKGGYAPAPDTSEAKMLAALEQLDLWTPMRYLNALNAGRVAAYDTVVLDEGHHSIAPTWNEVLATAGKAVALTATPYRGTPRGTEELHVEWGKPVWLITLREAVARGINSMPAFTVCPVLDDDTVEVVAGEFSEAGLDDLISPKLAAICDDIAAHSTPGAAGVTVVPSRAMAAQFADELAARGLRTAVVIGDTPVRERPALYDACERGELHLVVVAVLAEGVDRRFSEMFCVRPMRSPVAAMQLWGRMARRASVIRDYSRNVERFAYLWDGLLPLSTVREVQAAFGSPSKRAAARALDIEGVSRLKRLPIPLLDGVWAEGYMLQRTDTRGITEQFAVIYAPWLEKPIVASRPHNRADWSKTEIPAGLDGYNTLTDTQPMSDNQKKWWKRAARGLGLDPEAKVNRRIFAFLPALAQSWQNLRQPRA